MKSFLRGRPSAPNPLARFPRRAAALLLALVFALSAVALPASASGTAVIGGIVTAIKTVDQVVTILEDVYHGGSAAYLAHQDGKSAVEIFEAAIDGYNGVSESDESAYQETMLALRADLQNDLGAMTANVNAINARLTDLQEEEYINNFLHVYNGGYVFLSKSMYAEYEDLSYYFEKSFSTAEEVKSAYDELYAATEKLESCLAQFMTVGTLTGGKMTTVQDLLYSSIGEDSIPYCNALYETYVFSQYCLQICRIYQLAYCAETDASFYRVQESESFPVGGILSRMKAEKESYDKVAAAAVRFLGAHTVREIDVNLAGSRFFSTLPVTEAGPNEISKGDVLHLPMLPELYRPSFHLNGFSFESSDPSKATVSKSGVVRVLANSGDFTVRLVYDTDPTPEAGKVGTVYALNFTVRPSAFSGGLGTESLPYLLSNANDYKEFVRLCNSDAGYRAKHYVMTKNIDLGGAVLAPVSSFSGVLDGNGMTLSNFRITEHKNFRSGLFAENTGTVRGLTVGAVGTVTEVKVVTDELPKEATVLSVGAIVGHNGGRIEACTVRNVTVFGTLNDKNNDSYAYANVGGIAGYNAKTVSACTVESSTLTAYMGSVPESGDEAVGRVGGLVGENASGATVADSLARRNTLKAEVYGYGIDRTVDLLDDPAKLYAVVGGLCGKTAANSLLRTSVTYLSTGEAKIGGSFTEPHPLRGVAVGAMEGTCSDVLAAKHQIGDAPFGEGTVSGTKFFPSVDELKRTPLPESGWAVDADGNPVTDGIVAVTLDTAEMSVPALLGGEMNTSGLALYAVRASGKTDETPLPHYVAYPTSYTQTGDSSLSISSYAGLAAVYRTSVVCPHFHFEMQEPKSPTCTADGYTAGKWCLDCRTYVEGHEDLPSALGHTWDTGTVTVAPTHAASGTLTRVCTLCAAITTEAIPPIAHSYTLETPDAAYLASEATCTAPALYYYHCECGAVDGERTFVSGEPLGHSFTDYRPDEAGTDEASTRTETATCDRCTETDTRPYTPAESESTTEAPTDTASCDATVRPSGAIAVLALLFPAAVLFRKRRTRA